VNQHSVKKPLAMDPLGARPDTVEGSSIARWNTSDPEGPPPNVEDSVLPNAYTISPFPMREDLNGKIAVWYVSRVLWLFLSQCL